MGIRILHLDDPRGRAETLALRNLLRGGGLVAAGQRQGDVVRAVRRIIADVQARGDQAVVEWTRELHNVSRTPATLKVAPEQIEAARAAADESFLALIRRAAANIRRYQRRILLQAPAPLKRGGRELGVRYTPVERVAAYVPGGRAPYPSTLLMTVVPAQVAGVGQIVVVTPPGPDGQANPLVLALAGELGVGLVYCGAGVAVLAALAFGTETIRPVDKIVGPGNAFITETKRQLLGQVGIDSLAGPSEVLIVADDTARADWLAADMLAQAEHDPGSAVLLTPSPALARRVGQEIERQRGGLERAEAIRAALDKYSAIVVTADLAGACDLANEFAPEHLQIITGNERAVLRRIRHAGAIFLGGDTPAALGDYYAGPSHVLPTGGTARFFSPLSANDFLKAGSIVRYDAAALAADAADVAEFARREGLTAHARSVEIRKETTATETQRTRRREVSQKKKKKQKKRQN